jgi:hypothetical protein
MSISDPQAPTAELVESSDPEGLVKSRKRVADHGEVFTPSWMVEKMLDLVKDESERVDSRFLEPACGSGNFLLAVLRRKFTTIQSRSGQNDFEKRHNALFALMCIYGIELLEDNVTDCRNILLEELKEFLKIADDDLILSAARHVLSSNIIQGDALTLRNNNGTPIHFPEWGYLGKGKYQRRDFKYDSLTLRSGSEGTLFEMFEEHELFAPTKIYPQMNIEELAR